MRVLRPATARPRPFLQRHGSALIPAYLIPRPPLTPDTWLPRYWEPGAAAITLRIRSIHSGDVVNISSGNRLNASMSWEICAS